MSSYGTHNRAGEILYKRIPPYFAVTGSVTTVVYNYSFTIITYTDDSELTGGSVIADRCVDTIYFGDGQKAAAPRINGGTTCSCSQGACGEMIIISPAYKVKKNIYTVTHTYAGPGIYIAHVSDPNRNQGVFNIPNSVNVPFYIESMVIINSLNPPNSSPVLTNPPVDGGLVNACYHHNVCAYDPDGDSLSYAFVPCAAPGYFDPPAGAGGSFSVDPVSGLISWCKPQQIGEYNIAIRVTEWRKNTNGAYQTIGHVTRDMQILVFNGTPLVINSSSIADTCIVAGTVISKAFSASATGIINVTLYGSTNNGINPPDAVVTPSTGTGVLNASYNLTSNCSQARKLPYSVNLVFDGGN
ncbi:MAG: hypothetical protein K0S12_2044, partial [Bacteroidetes bacterium]|nr:hypothetical protein [Bacteroidota bacterium]